MMEPKQRYSRQREAIVQQLSHRCDHPSADMIYESLRPDYPHISLGTVYRNLKSLSAEGVIGRLTVEGKERFDGNLTPHVHFVCTGCGAIVDIHDDAVDDFLAHIAYRTGGTIAAAQLVIRGRCHSCQE